MAQNGLRWTGKGSAMDERTLAAYDADPQKYCRDWLGQRPPEEIHISARRYFLTGGETAEENRSASERSSR
jgi:hypothetical protein